MGEIRPPEPVALICGILAGREEWLEAALQLLERHLGTIEEMSDVFPFDCTRYYEPAMGPNLLRRFAAFSRLIDPGRLAEIKHLTNRLEGEVVGEVPRPVNLDPGTLNGSQLVLASTKPYAHRVYLRDGIYAEVTLVWSAREGGGWRALPWTYPDYAAATYHPFLRAVRARYLAVRRASRAVRAGGEPGEAAR